MEISKIKDPGKEVPVLLTSVLVIAVCGILYELLISTISTYFLGSSILHFSITIGLFLSAMGIGSFLSRFFKEDLLDSFVSIEIALGIIGGVSALILHISFSVTENYYLTAFFLILVLGTLIGIEIPVLTRILRNYDSLREAISNVLAFDYLGSLFASVVFPLVLLPYLGIMRTAFVVGLLNLAIALFNCYIFKDHLKNVRKKIMVTTAAMLVMVVGFVYSFDLSGMLEQYLYEDEIIFSEQSPYQRIVVTRNAMDTRLYINGNLQFSTIDEHRYHEPIVHILMAFVKNPENILLLGAGDGLAVREVLKYPEVCHVDVIDLDPIVTQLASENPIFASINNYAIVNPKVRVINDDAYNFIQHTDRVYNLVVVDLTDPNSPSVGKLYTKEFYELLKKVTSRDGVVVTQSSSPFFAPKAFWCIHRTLESVFHDIVPFNSYMPTFGIWGFNMGFASPPPYLQQEGSGELGPVKLQQRLTAFLENKKILLQNRCVTPETVPGFFVFDADMTNKDVEVNKLDNQVLVEYYEQSWLRWD